MTPIRIQVLYCVSIMNTRIRPTVEVVWAAPLAVPVEALHGSALAPASSATCVAERPADSTASARPRFFGDGKRELSRCRSDGSDRLVHYELPAVDDREVDPVQSADRRGRHPRPPREQGEPWADARGGGDNRRPQGSREGTDDTDALRARLSAVEDWNDNCSRYQPAG